MSTVDVDDVKRLMASDHEDPVLVLLHGQPRVIDAQDQDAEENRGALFVASRRGVLEQAGAPGNAPAELERIATVLSDMADRLGA